MAGGTSNKLDKQMFEAILLQGMTSILNADGRVKGCCKDTESMGRSNATQHCTEETNAQLL